MKGNILRSYCGSSQTKVRCQKKCFKLPPSYTFGITKPRWGQVICVASVERHFWALHQATSRQFQASTWCAATLQFVACHHLKISPNWGELQSECTYGEVSWSQPVQYQLLYLWCKTLAQGMRPVVSSDSHFVATSFTILVHHQESRIKNNKRRAVRTFPPTSSWFSWKDRVKKMFQLGNLSFQWSAQPFTSAEPWTVGMSTTTFASGPYIQQAMAWQHPQPQLALHDNFSCSTLNWLSNAEVELIPDIPK